MGKTTTSTKKKQTLQFYTTGEGMTNLIRDTWTSDLPKKALAMCTDGMGMNDEQALLVITGKNKLVGDTREGDGTLSMADDNTEEMHGIKLDLNTMIGRLERKYVEHSESINLLSSVEDFEYEDDEEYNQETIRGYQTQLAEVTEQLQAVYALVGKTLKNLPVDKVRSANKQKKDYKKENPDEFVTRIKEEEKEVSVTDVVETVTKKEAKPKLLSKEEQRNQVFHSLAGNPFYIVHTPIKKCKKEHLTSGWLLPDGTFYGGRGIWIHRGILEELSEYDFFKDKPYSADEDSVTDDGGWVKLYSGDWMIWEHKNNLTKEQIEFIIEFNTEVLETAFIKMQSFHKVHIQVFAELLNGREFDVYEMEKESEGLPELEKKDDFPSREEVGEIDVLSTPFFVPDNNFASWIVEYANGRTIVDCGAGSGYLSALLIKNGGKVLGIDPHWTIERKMFWIEQGYMFNVFQQQAEECYLVLDLDVKNLLFVFARPCHSGFVSRTIDKLKKGAEVLYISHNENEKFDLSGIKYKKVIHQGTSLDNEYVLVVKK